MRRYCHIVANGRSRYVQWKCWPCIVFAGAPIIRFVGAVHKVAGRISGLRRYRQLSPPHKHTLKPGFLRFFSTRKIPPTAHGKNLTDLTMMMAIPRCWISRAVKHRTCAVPFSPCNRERQNLHSAPLLFNDSDTRQNCQLRQTGKGRCQYSHHVATLQKKGPTTKEELSLGERFIDGALKSYLRDEESNTTVNGQFQGVLIFH